MPLTPNLPGVPPPSAPTGGPRPPSALPGAAGDLLEPDFAPVYTAWKARPSLQANGLMLRTIDPIIQSAVKTYGGSAPSPTLVSKARKMALEVLPRYDPSKTKMKTFLMSQLQGLRRASAKDTSIINVPEQVQLDHFHLSKAEDELRDQLGRDPSTDELADLTGLSTRRIVYVRKLQMPASEGGILQPIQGGEGDDFNDPAVRTLSGGDDARAWHQFVYASLSDPADQVIMEHSLGLHAKAVLSNQEIARKLGVTPSAVSQRKARIQSKLDERAHLGIL